MTTRKELIARIQAMQLGTQEMLDAAANDATLIPLDTLFCDEAGNARWRKPHEYDDSEEVCVVSDTDSWKFRCSQSLHPMAEE